MWRNLKSFLAPGSLARLSKSTSPLSNHSSQSNFQRSLHVTAKDTVISPAAVKALQEGLDIDEEPFMLSVEYGPFGYFPMTLGQKLPLPTTSKQDYKIVRKLGWGRNSSVWLAEDMKSVGSKKYEAIKILTVNTTSALTYKLYHEHKVYAILKKHITDKHPGRAHCITCTGMVLIQSVHGIHACFFAPAHGSTIGDLLASQPQYRFNLGITKKIIKQTLLGLNCMHSVLGVVHGDMKPENLLVEIDVDDEMLSGYLDAYPATTYPPRTDIALWDEPMVTVKSEPLPNFGLDPSFNNLKIIVTTEARYPLRI